MKPGSTRRWARRTVAGVGAVIVLSATLLSEGPARAQGVRPVPRGGAAPQRPPLVVVAPNGGENLVPGSTFAVRWDCAPSLNGARTLTLEACANSACADPATIKPIATVAVPANSCGSPHNWTVPGDWDPRAQWKIRARFGDSPSDVSNAPFKITGIALTFDSQGRVWPRTAGVANHFTLYYNGAAGRTFKLSVIGSPGDFRQELKTVTSGASDAINMDAQVDIPHGLTYKLEVASTSGSPLLTKTYPMTYLDTSHAITFSFPGSNSGMTVGQSSQLAWRVANNPSACLGDRTVKLVKGTAVVRDIAVIRWNNNAVDGYAWTVPDIAEASDYRIQVQACDGTPADRYWSSTFSIRR